MSEITNYIASLPKPDCAVNVNGNYLEDLVHGYRTHSVTGRNAISTSITEVTIGNSNGSRYRRKRDESRDLTVSFAITAENYWAVHRLSQLLQNMLNTANSEFIFADQPDVYWVGSVSDFSEDYPDASGSDIKALVGTFTIRCSDPYRHATTKVEVTTNGLKGTNVITLTNNGTIPTPLYIEAYMWDPSRYLAYSLDKDPNTSFAYILGTTGEASPGSQSVSPVTVLSSKFTSDPGWTKNSGVLPPLLTSGTQVGSVIYDKEGVKPSDYGEESSYWHGPSLSHIIPSQNGSYPQNWKANYCFDFDDGHDDPKSWGLQSMVFADGGGEPIVSIILVDSADNQTTEVRAIVGRTTNILGSIPNNGKHVVSGGNMLVEKIGSDIHVNLSYPKATSTNTIQRETPKGTKGKIIIKATQDFNQGTKFNFTGTFEETSVDPNTNSSVITWDAHIDQNGNPFYGETQIDAGIVDVYIDGTIVCTEFVPLVYNPQAGATGAFVNNTWTSGKRYFRVTHDALGKKNAQIRVALRGGGHTGITPNIKDTYYELTDIERSATIANTVGYITLDAHYTSPNPTTTIRQVTWWMAAYSKNYTETIDSDGNISKTEGHKQFKNNKLRSLTITKYSDTKTIAKDNSSFFSAGDTISIDSEINDVRQNGNKNLNMIDITSEPLMLYPGTHNLKVAVNNATANRPPTLLITYREQWK